MTKLYPINVIYREKSKELPPGPRCPAMARQLINGREKFHPRDAFQFGIRESGYQECCSGEDGEVKKRWTLLVNVVGFSVLKRPDKTWTSSLFEEVAGGKSYDSLKLNFEPCTNAKNKELIPK